MAGWTVSINGDRPGGRPGDDHPQEAPLLFPPAFTLTLDAHLESEDQDRHPERAVVTPSTADDTDWMNDVLGWDTEPSFARYPLAGMVAVAVRQDNIASWRALDKADYQRYGTYVARPGVSRLRLCLGAT